MDIINIFRQFIPTDDFIAFKRYGNGHINSTYLVISGKKENYILQRINTNIFTDVDLLMNNINEVTEHLGKKGIETIHMLRAVDGKLYVESEGNFYRMYKFIDRTITIEAPEGLKTVSDAAQAFGRFHNQLADLDATKLGEVIPHFHDTPKRYNDLQIAIKNDVKGRAKDVQREINIINKYKEVYSYIVKGIESGEVKNHITHNDPKINNALFDDYTKEFRAVIDLDTVMPGSVLYDFGDALRSLFTGDKEDAKDYENVVGKLDVYETYLTSYYAEAKYFLTKREIELFPYAPFILTMECGIRFLEDHLKGDTYFRIHRENHNLDRARTQINLAQSIIENIDKYIEITNKVCK